ncbi:MAG: xanthine dehydrogenase family protein molybdopterin-binding subunit, partial [Acidobacteriota bacterium]
MADPSWPAAAGRTLLGRRTSRLDGPAKSGGRVRYTFDINRPGMLFARVVRCPHAHARILKIDVEKARRIRGVKAVRIIQKAGADIKWAGDEIAAVAAVSEEIAGDAARAVKVEYEVLPHFVTEEDLHRAPDVKPAQAETTGDPDAAMAAAEVKIAGEYGLPSVAHCCLESHGQVCEWTGEKEMTAWCSTQNVSGLPGQFAEGLGIPAAGVRVITDHLGGGFGSKFGVDRWGSVCAQLAREA